MSILPKKLIISFLLGLTIFASVGPSFLVTNAAPQQPPPSPGASPAPSASTAPTWYNQGFGDWFNKVFDTKNPSEIFGERYTAAQTQWVVYGVFSVVINTFLPPKTAAIVACVMGSMGVNQTLNACIGPALTAQTEQPAFYVEKRGLTELVFADRSFSGITYLKEKIANFNLVPVARAQTVGFGFDALGGPIQGAWKAFRDIAFGLFVLVAIVFAFMIMFRIKLSPQTVISVQSALPKIITALILVTFSYAIAGFLIDFMYVVIALLSVAGNTIYNSTIGFNVPFVGPNTFFNLMTLGQPFGLNIQAGVLGLIIIFFYAFFGPLILLLLIAGLPIMLIPVAGPVLYVIFAVLIYIIAILITVWTGIKIVWSLVKAYANIVLLTIFAPIQISLGTIIPSIGFGQWIKSYIANLSVFVVTGGLFLFSYLFVIMGTIIGLKSFGIVAIASLLGPLGTAVASIVEFAPRGGWPPLLGTGTDAFAGLLFLAVGFVLFTLMPKASEIIQGLLSGKPFAYGTAIGEAFGGVGWAYGASGARDSVEMTRKALREERLRASFASAGTAKEDLLQRSISALENAPVIGGQVTNVRQKIKGGLEHHS